jgi:hypothetical protein
VAPSLTRGRVCPLYTLLTLASAVFLGSESLETRDHILLSQICDFPFRRPLDKVEVKITLRLTVSQSVSKSWCRAPSGTHDHVFITLWQLRSCFYGAPFLTFVFAAGPCQRSLSRVRVPWDSRPYFIVSDLGLLRQKVKVKVILRLTISQSVSLGIEHPSGAHDQIFFSYMKVTLLFNWGALSDERTGLSFILAAGPCQRSISRVRVPWDSRPYFIVSALRTGRPLPPRKIPGTHFC